MIKLKVPRTQRALTDLDGNLRVYRVVCGFLLTSMLWKVHALPTFYHIYGILPLHDPFFPTPLRSRVTLATAFVTVIVSLAGSITCRRPRWIRCLSVTANIGLFVLCLHQGSYNDVTFMTCWWTSLWTVWFAAKLNEPWSTLGCKAKFLSAAILSLMFLGGAVGKWTEGYWSGEVLYEIYFKGRDYWVFNLLRSHLSAEALRDVATWYSRVVVVVESLGAVIWLLPPPWASAFAIVTLLGIALLSNVFLFSVIFCLLGLAIVGFHEPNR